MIVCCLMLLFALLLVIVGVAVLIQSDLFIMTDATGLHSNTGIPTHSWNGQVDEVDSVGISRIM